MDTQIKVFAIINFRNIFPQEQKPTINELLKGIPTCSILKIIGYFMAQVHANEDNIELQSKIFNFWLDVQEDKVKQTIKIKFDEFIDNKKSNFQFFSNITSLYFIQYLFVNYNSDVDRELTADEELRLFKAYLIVSEEWSDKEVEFLSQSPKNEDELVAYILPFQMKHNEIQSYKDFRAQFIKAIYFFQFLEQDKDLGKYLPDFLGKYGLKTWKEYLMNALTPYILSLSEGKKPSILVFNESHNLEVDFWDTFCIKLDDYSPKSDFLELRESPVFKLQDFNYIFYNFNFVIDKLYQALQFVFSKLLIEKGVVENFGNFKSKYYSEQFSENFMFYKTIEYCFINQKNIISFNGEQLADLLGEKGPDYYIRIDNHLILIEFKDVLMGAGPKVSYDFNQISAEISRKLVKNEGGHAKGVGQLARFINEMPVGGFDFDPIDGDKINIYPIMVVTDTSFTLFGINFLLQQEFLKLINLSDCKDIKWLSLIGLDTFLLYQDSFNENRISLFDILIGYDFGCKQEKSIYKFSSLDKYFIDYINNNHIPTRNLPNLLMEFFQNEL